MARTGLYKSEVKKARDVLLAQGKYPSVDAVRIELGNTGSKTTIHKYLKELEEEGGDTDARKVSISETLQDLVARLAAQLQEEANAQIDAMRIQHAEQERLHAEALEKLEKMIEAGRSQLARVETALQEEERVHAHAREELQRETVARHTAEQQVLDLKERLVENEKHRQSLEEKHQHARDALEHYRQSMKEQREQDQRQREQQLQQLQADIRHLQQSLVIKHEETTRLNREGARLVAELSHTQKALHDEQSNNHRLSQKLETLLIVESRLADRELNIQNLKVKLGDMTEEIANLNEQLLSSQLDLTATKATLTAQQDLITELRGRKALERKISQ